METIEQARKKLNGHWPINLKYFFYKGVRITKAEFLGWTLNK